MKVWDIITSESYNEWFGEQTEDDKAVIFGKIYLLSEYGPNLGRPHADTLKGSKKLKNLKELRPQTNEHVFRIAYIFDPERKGVILTGGDKKGKDGNKFYKNLIKEAEQIYAAYLEKKYGKEK